MEKCEGRTDEGIEEQWRRMEARLKRMLREVEEKREKELKIGRKRSWWDEDCREGKKRVRKMLRNWGKRGGGI